MYQVIIVIIGYCWLSLVIGGYRFIIGYHWYHHVSLFPNMRRNFATSIRVPASSILTSFSLGTSHSFYMWPQIFEWAGADTNQGRRLFHSVQAIVQILFEGGFDVRVLFAEIRYALVGEALRHTVVVCVCTCVCVYMCMCVCVCVRERESAIISALGV